MSLIKSVSIPGGYSAEFWTVNSFERFDNIAQEAVIVLSLWQNAAEYAAHERPAVERAGRLILTGEKFAQWVSKAALAASEVDIYAQIYAAIKAGEPVDFWFARASTWLADATDA